MSLAAKVATLLASMQLFGETVKSKILPNVPLAVKSNVSAKLGNKTIAEHTSDAEAELLNHTNNALAHNADAETFDTYEIPYIDAILGEKIQRGILPISKASISAQCEFFNNIAQNRGEIVTIDLVVVLSGLFWSFPGEQFHTVIGEGPSDIPNINAWPPGTTCYLYLELYEGRLYFSISQTPKSESNTLMWIATQPIANLLASGAFPTDMDDAPILRVDTMRISTTAKGSSIPVSGENPTLLWT